MLEVSKLCLQLCNCPISPVYESTGALLVVTGALLVVTGALLVVTGALLVVTRSY